MVVRSAAVAGDVVCRLVHLLDAAAENPALAADDTAPGAEGIDPLTRRVGISSTLDGNGGEGP
jgi:hypothetical protein